MTPHAQAIQSIREALEANHEFDWLSPVPDPRMQDFIVKRSKALLMLAVLEHPAQAVEGQRVDIQALKSDCYAHFFGHPPTADNEENDADYMNVIDEIVDYIASHGLLHPAAETSQPQKTGLVDKRGKPILVGNIVHWSDGGDDLSLDERIATRWDRIAVVEMDRIMPVFRAIDSPHPGTKAEGHTFNYGSFIYKDTENHLTVVASGLQDYRARFKSAGECMGWVLRSSARPTTDSAGDAP